MGRREPRWFRPRYDVIPLAVASPFFRSLSLEDYGLSWIHPPASGQFSSDGSQQRRISAGRGLSWGMDTSARELATVHALLAHRHDSTPRDLLLERQPLRGGLEAASITRVAARYRDQRGHRQVVTLVVKRLSGAAAREALVYQHVLAPHPERLAPGFLGADQQGPDRSVLFLEALRPVRRWPWRDTRVAQTVLTQAARLHQTRLSPGARAVLAAWDYEAQLYKTARVTLQRLERIGRDPDYRRISAGVRRVRRLVADLPALRRQLAGFTPFEPTVIHGDLHPGNAIVRRRRGRDEAVLLDWGRARVGSPLEDVSSWLQSLGCWEPEARRRHDSLLVGYLSARGLQLKLGSELRVAYWLAGASNALSGALAYHLSVLLDARVTGRRRAIAAYSAREWIRVLRRADALWR